MARGRPKKVVEPITVQKTVDGLILCSNRWEGLCFVLEKKLKDEKIEIEIFNSKDNADFFLKNRIKSLPVLLCVENGEVVEKIATTEDILKTIKEHV